METFAKFEKIQRHLRRFFAEILRSERCKKHVNLVDLIKSFLLAEFGVDTAENETVADTPRRAT